MGSETCAYPRDTEGAHDHDACEDGATHRCQHAGCPWWIATLEPALAADRLALHLRRKHAGQPA